MRKLLLTLMASASLFGCSKETITSTTPPSTAVLSNDEKMEQIKANLIKEVPGIGQIDAVNPSPVSGIYEVQVGRKVFYVSADEKYLIFGNIIDRVNQKDLTQDRLNELSMIDWSKLPLDLAIKHVNGTGKRQIAVFSDPDCPYCKLFEKQVVPELKDVTIYTFLFPLPMHQNARANSEKIWCSKDRDQAWTNWMQKDKSLPTTAATCDTSSLDKVFKIGADLVKVSGTPTIILSNGQIIPGMVPANQLSVMIDEASGKPSVKQPDSTTAVK